MTAALLVGQIQRQSFSLIQAGGRGLATAGAPLSTSRGFLEVLEPSHSSSRPRGRGVVIPGPPAVRLDVRPGTARGRRRRRHRSSRELGVQLRPASASPFHGRPRCAERIAAARYLDRRGQYVRSAGRPNPRSVSQSVSWGAIPSPPCLQLGRCHASGGSEGSRHPAHAWSLGPIGHQHAREYTPLRRIPVCPKQILMAHGPPPRMKMASGQGMVCRERSKQPKVGRAWCCEPDK